MNIIESKDIKLSNWIDLIRMKFQKIQILNSNQAKIKFLGRV